MRFLALLTILPLLAGPAGAQEPAREAPTAESVAAARAALAEAVRSKDAARIVAALEATHGVPASAVVDDVVEVLADEREEVRLAALQALRWIEHPAALAALERLAKDAKRMRAAPFAEAVVRGLGQHADPGSVGLIARSPFEPPEGPVLRARVLALGRIRTVESIEALLGMLGAVHGPRGERRLEGQLDAVRTSLVLLTGVDQGREPEAWERWWRENRRGFRVPEEAPALPEELRRPWDTYWGLPTVYARERRREDRGGDEPRR